MTRFGLQFGEQRLGHLGANRRAAAQILDQQVCDDFRRRADTVNLVSPAMRDSR